MRKSLGLSQSELGKRIGVSRAAISRLEGGSNNFTNQMITSICREFNVNERWLRTGEGEIFKSEISLCDEYDTFSIRLKQLRKSLDLTQQEFADVIGTARNNIAGYETGKRQPSDAVISLICKTDFSKGRVNETWLRTGEGEIFNETSSEQFQSENSFEDNLISVLTQISNQLERIADTLTKDEEHKKKDQL